MKITPNIIQCEFIGANGNVVESIHSNYVGVGGEVIGETKNTLTFRNEGKAKSVIKESAVFNFRFGDGSIVQIDGKLLVGRPENRLKKSIKRLW